MDRAKHWCAGALSLLVLSACGSGQVAVTAELDLPDPETGDRIVRPLTDLRVQLLPFDRDLIFDSLSAAAPSPEPQLPAALAAKRDSIAEARQTWTEAEGAWLAARDRLQEIQDEITQFSRAEAQYRILVQEFDREEARANQAERVKDEAFESFDRMQREAFAELEQFSASVMAWEDEAFADWELVVAARLNASGLEILTDTTDASGAAFFSVSPGDWWVHARQPEATHELYWNELMNVQRGDPVQVRLSRENAEVREIY
ncbi:MAG: hypothetical protein WEG36_12020 [Gemmatimonadota bacterium]